LQIKHIPTQKVPGRLGESNKPPREKVLTYKSYTFDKLLLTLLKTLPIIGPNIISAAITTMATNLQIG
jgi:hypothetical protein